ncbi:MAG: ANTAR domain-containing protein [Dermatophilaceae bacterium]|nr:ANTAR domain-containing protein [Dermatophilaceae bacterium]
MANEPQSDSDPELSRQIEELRAQLSVNRDDIEALQAESGHAAERADASEKQAQDDRQRIVELEHHAEIEDQLIAVLRAEGLLKDQKAAHLREALGTSRRIGAALGIIMVAYKVDEAAAFDLLRAHSQNTNRKVRELADEVVETGDVTGLVPPS